MFFIRKIVLGLLLCGCICQADDNIIKLSPFAKKVRKVRSGEVYMRVNAEKQHGETCNPTSMSMILDYYGVRVSSAKLCKDSEDNKDENARESYKTSAYLEEQLKKYKMKMLWLPMRQGYEKEVFEVVKRSIDCGLMLQWLVHLLEAPDYDVPRRMKKYIRKEGGNDGHARVIHGYVLNKKNKQLKALLFSDSWGVKHRKKDIALKDVVPMTKGFFIVVPQNINIKVIKYIYEPVIKLLKEK